MDFFIFFEYLIMWTFNMSDNFLKPSENSDSNCTPSINDDDWDNILDSMECFWFDTIEWDTMIVSSIVNQMMLHFKIPIINKIHNKIMNDPENYTLQDELEMIRKLNEINYLVQDISIKAKCLEKMFAFPPRDSNEQYDRDNCPHIAVYRDKKLAWANKAYADCLWSLWISTMDEAKKLSATWYEDDWRRKNALIEKIYFGKHKEKVYEKILLLWINKGYQNEHFILWDSENEELEAKTLSWSSFWIDWWKWSVRVWMDVSYETKDMSDDEIKFHLNKYYSNEWPLTTHFWFIKSLELFKEKIQEIHWKDLINKDFNDIYTNLLFFAHIADLIFDNSPFAMNLYRWKKLINANRQYINLTGKTFPELLELSEKWILWKLLFWDWIEEKLVTQSIASLNKEWWHYHRQFSFIPTNSFVEFDTYDIWDWYTFRVGKRDPSVEMMDI